MTLPSMPHLGSTGVIQNPGDLGAIAQGLSGLPQILMAAEQAKRQQEMAALNQQYLQAQMQHMAAQEEAQRNAAMSAAAENTSVGEFIGNLTTPQPGYGWNPGWQNDPMTVEQAIQRTPAPHRAAALDKGKDAIKANETARAEKQSRAKFQQAIKSLDPATQEALSTIAALGEGTPADVRTSVYNRISGVKEKQGIEGYSSAFNAGAITLGQYLDAAGLPLPPGADPNFKKPERPDPFALINYRLGAEEDRGTATEGERRDFIESRQIIAGIRGLESGSVKAPSRLMLQGMSQKSANWNEFVKQNVSGPMKSWVNAAALFLNPVLRSETGAAFGQMEPMMVVDRFIELADDPPDTKARKAKARRDMGLALMGSASRHARAQIRERALDPNEWEADREYLLQPPVLSKFKGLEP